MIGEASALQLGQSLGINMVISWWVIELQSPSYFLILSQSHSLQMMLLCMPENFVTVAQSFVGVASSWGLTVSLVKTKGMKIDNEPSFVDGVPVYDESVEMIREFSYLLGSTISCDCGKDSDVKVRIAKAANAFGCLKKSIFTNNCLSIAVKHAVYKAVVLVTLLYGSECWAVKVYQLEVFHHRCVQCILGVSRHQQWTKHISNHELLREFGMIGGLNCVKRETYEMVRSCL